MGAFTRLTMTNPFLIFCAGFASGSVPLIAFIVIYYVRARRRVASIKAAIQRYNEATRTVGAATEKTYGKASRQ